MKPRRFQKTRNLIESVAMGCAITLICTLCYLVALGVVLTAMGPAPPVVDYALIAMMFLIPVPGITISILDHKKRRLASLMNGIDSATSTNLGPEE